MCTIVPIGVCLRGMKCGESPSNRRGQPAIRKGLLEAYILPSALQPLGPLWRANLCSLPAVDAQQIGVDSKLTWL